MAHSGNVALTVAGQPQAPRLPALLAPAQRAAGGQDDPFLPADYLQATGLVDVTPAARSVTSTVQQIDATQGDLLALEMTDGSTLITSAASLQAALATASPELIDAEGRLRLDALCAGAAEQQRGLGTAIGSLVRKIYTFALRPTPDRIIDAAIDLLKQKGLEQIELGVSWWGTQALMAAIEGQLKAPPGLHRWVGHQGQGSDLAPTGPITGTEPMLVFVHGTASSSLGSFGELRSGDPALWSALVSRFQDRIYAFEHRTLSQSPIENAIALVEALPEGAQVSLVTHSRGGLVGDLLCLRDFDALIDSYAYALEGTGDADPAEAARVKAELAEAHARQRGDLKRLAQLLRQRRITIQRYVRTASPASGTKLAGANFDLFLSGLLTLVGAIPGLFGSPLYSAFKRVVIEIAKHRTNPHLVPGIEAMLPDSPLARLLRDAPVQPGIAMATIAGDIQGGHLLQRLGVMLTDVALFDREDNDLVVNTTAMLAGVAPRAEARVLFDRGADVSHFRYFTNADTRHAMQAWLVCQDPTQLSQFQPLPRPGDYAAAMAAATAASRSVAAADRPVVVVLPGIMGTHLRAGSQRVWLDPLQLATGKLSRLAWDNPSVEGEALFAMFYGKACAHLAQTHRVEPFPYDWRQPLDVLADRLGEHLDHLLKSTQQPVRLLAHSMGGLVIRACIHKRPAVMDALMARDGARLVMLGTPNQGAHSMVANLLGKGDSLRTLTRLDLAHDMQQVLDIVATMPGALQLLPRPGFHDDFQGQPTGGEWHDYQSADTWVRLKAQNTDIWFGDHRAGTPSQATLDAGSWLWQADAKAGGPALPDHFAAKSIYVYGVAAQTPCGIRQDRHKLTGQTRVRLLSTPRGDGTVTWQSGRIGGIGSSYYLPAEHGDLLSTEDTFGALVDLLCLGSTQQLATSPPAMRATERDVPRPYEPAPPNTDDPDAQLRQLMGGSPRLRMSPRSRRRLDVTVKAMDLRFLAQPILVGHYEQDPIAGAEWLIDHELLDGDLSERYRLGLYASRRGEATVVLRRPNGMEAARSSLTGAIVTGLGSYERPLNPASLTEAVRVGALRYLLQVIDVLGPEPRELPLASLLLGYNSSANLTVAASVEALVRGILEANERFFDTTGLHIRIAQLDIVELYLDTAISAAYALRELGPALGQHAQRCKTQLICHNELMQGDGLRHRLFDGGGASYWPRLIITRSDQCDNAIAAAGAGPLALPSAATAVTPAAIADQLRYIYVGQRARAETVALQRQPGLVEALVAAQIGNPQWNEAFGRTLFQLMIPYDFKDAARQLARVVLVVDGHTANLPWELMLADDPTLTTDERLPLALRTAVVRQLSSSTYRPVVRQGMSRCALVIGNPSVDGFSQAFSLDDRQPVADPVSLPGAEEEAEAAQRILGMARFDVTSLIGSFWPAHEVMPHLYERAWRVLHVSAHGVFGLMHRDGRPRSGVLLSNGLLITAAEIAAMETVPELVFLNCCHLGQVDQGKGANKLAASVARELMEVGVRCVIVAGWAVNDQSARIFAESFYEQLMLRGLPFGDAVFEARKTTFRQQPTDITWGAFQAYGDPAWKVDPQSDGSAGRGAAAPFVSPDELLDELARQRTRLCKRHGDLDAKTLQDQARSLDDLLRLRCPAHWPALPHMQSALGDTWFDFGAFDKAREAYLAAIQAEDRLGLVPIRAIERLANAEVRLADQLLQTNPERTSPRATERTLEERAQRLIHSAVQRLEQLDALVARRDEPAPSGPSVPPNAERAALTCSAWKRLVTLEARQHCQGIPAPDLETHLTHLQALYRAAEGTAGSPTFKPYLALNRLALLAAAHATPPLDDAAYQAEIDLARQCAGAVAQAFPSTQNAWDAVMQAEAVLVEQLLTGALAATGAAGNQALDALKALYDQTLGQARVTPAMRDSIISQLGVLAQLHEARAVLSKQPAPHRTAERLRALADHLQPDRPRGNRATTRETARPTISRKAAGKRPNPSAPSPAAAKREKNAAPAPARKRKR